MKISVVIPTYNRLRFLQQALASVWAQTYCDYELIVVDDGSNDGTLEYLASLGDRIKLICQQRGGPGAARNSGIQRASGDYLAFLDSDDLWLPWTLATFHRVTQKYKPSLICGAVVEFSDVAPSLEEGELQTEQFPDYLKTARQPGFVPSCVLVVDRSTFVRARGFDEGLSVAEDHDFLFRVGTAPGFVRVQSPITTMYRRHVENTSSLRSVACASVIAILNKEAEGRYPGGNKRQMERWQLLGRMLRPIALAGVKAGLGEEPWRLYWQGFWLNARLGRFRFLIGFLFYGMRNVLRRLR